MTTMTCTRFWSLVAGCVALPALLLAQDGNANLPVFSGKGAVTEAVDMDQGAVFDLGSGITMTFPKGLPIGRSRTLTLKKASAKLTAAHVQPGFVPAGTVLEFGVPLNAQATPIELTMGVKADPRKSGRRLVLAMEIGTLCSEQHNQKLPNGLCSGWEIVPADYDATSRRMIAKLSSTGGFRMVFGTLPEPKESE